MEKYRVRFAPSPTGNLHVGNARTAIFNWLLARKSGGEMVFRLEDTDVERSTEASKESIKKDIKWLGLNWDEGPFLQSERLHIYQEHLEKLLETGMAYRCFCTPEEISQRREKRIKIDGFGGYDGTCRKLTAEQVQEKVDAGLPFSYRFKITGKTITVNDLVRGKIDFDLNTIGDFIIMRPNGYPTYNFSVVIDDALMKIDHIMRGEDILPSTPKQILLYQAFGYPVPQFGHLSMINGPTGRPLHKRDGATSLSAFRTGGYIPEAMFNFLALLGWSPKDDSEIIPMDDIIRRFSLKDVAKSPAQFDYEKLNWMNGQYLRALSNEALLPMVEPFIAEVYPQFSNYTTQEKETIIEAIKNRMDLLSDAPELVRFFVEKLPLDDDATVIAATEDYTAVVESLVKIIGDLEEPITFENYKKMIIKAVQKDSGRKGKALFMSLRVAVTGSTKGIDLSFLFVLLSKNELLKRVQA